MTDQVRVYWETWAHSVAAGPLDPTERLELADELMRVAVEEPRINAQIAELTEQLRLANIDAFNSAAEVAELRARLEATT